jgi:conjugative transfer pilus assembly protein TraH
MKKLLCLAMLLFAKSAYAGIDTELEGFFKNMGYGVNVTGSGAYESQSGGYYHGGRVYARVPSRGIQLMNLQAPSFSAGCGGIDLFAGGMSFIKADDFVKAARNIANNAVGYAVNLSLQNVSPTIYNTINKLNDIAREVNNMNISSCEAAANVVGGIWPRSDASSRYLCSAMGTGEGNFFSDWAQARQGCGAEGQRDEVNRSKKAGFEDQLGDEFNLVWEAIRKNGFLSKDKDLAEVFMSISGTIISKKVGDTKNPKFVQTYLASLANDQGLIDVLLYGESKSGASPNIYSCDVDNENKCLNPGKKVLSVSKTRALVVKVEGLLRSIAEKSRNYDEKGLSAEEKGLIEATKIPILKIILVQNAFKGGSSVINVNEFSEGIAYDLVLQFMEQVLDLVTQSLKELEKIQIDGKTIAEFKEDIREVRRQIIERRNGVYQQMHTMLDTIQKTKLAEGQLQHMFSSYSSLEE